MEKTFHNLILTTIIATLVAGCIKKPVNFGCDDPSIQSSLISQAKFVTNDNLVSESILKIKQLNQANKCEAAIKYQHVIFTNKQLAINYSYQINNANGSIIRFDPESKYSLLKKWYTAIPDIISFQKTQNGYLAIIQPQNIQQRHNQPQSLYLNNQEVYLESSNFSSITIDRKFVINHNDVFLISAYHNQNLDKNTDHSYLVAIESNNDFSITKAFSYQQNSFTQTKDNLKFNGLNHKWYAESTDYPVYFYQNNQLLKIQSTLPDSYYTAKFSKVTAEQIIKQVKADGCLNGDQFYSSDICSQKKIRYCQEFQLIGQKNKSRAYTQLKQMCAPYQFSEY